MRKIIFDIETKNLFEEVGSNDPAALDISVIGIYDSKTDTYAAYTDKELKQVWPIIESADVLITYNGDHFDIPLLNKYYPGDLSKIKSLDLLVEIRAVLGRRLKLDSVAEATLGKKKIGHGLEAVEWYKQGEIEKIKKYCLEDVKITKEVYEYALVNSHLKYKDNGELKQIKLDTSKWQDKKESALTFTLPF
ncbi:hypothetical protein EPO17_00210 [Patescibacteria group bacterium]|nr:MAG: hypothetical protein EPO17_00210 [Patescibacteria group bacterium]